MNHTTVIVPYTFELLEVKLKKLNKQLSEAEWTNDVDLISKLMYDIDTIKVAIGLGEKYDVPF